MLKFAEEDIVFTFSDFKNGKLKLFTVPMRTYLLTLEGCIL